MEKKYKELFSYISDTDESCASDILYSLELVKTSLNTTLKRIKREIQIATDQDSFDGIGKIAGYCKEITEINQEIEQLISALHFNTVVQSADTNDRGLQSASIQNSHAIDYTDFDVSRTDPHTLDESFEHKKICGLKIHGTSISVENWQDALVKLCAHLYKIDGKRMNEFLSNPRFRGKKIDYFMTTYVPKKNKAIPGTNLYVWINNSANLIATIMKRMLEEYNIPLQDLTIYLRRDLSELHKQS